MNVLSLFDGMACGRIALDRVGARVDNYYASEIDSHAMRVARDNYPNITHIGDVTKVSGADAPVPIDLLMAGSPCQGFSYAGKQLNFDDPRSALFFDFVRIKEEVNPKYFLLENVRMKQEFQDVISRAVGAQPIAINSSLVSGQSRPRLYWTNIPDVTQPSDKNVRAKSVIDVSNTTCNSSGWQKWWCKNEKHQLRKQYSKILNDVDKGVCQTARQVANWNGNLVRNPSGTLRFASVLECERLQTVPENYTKSVSNAQAYKMLGNGWTVDVIVHILRGLPNVL